MLGFIAGIILINILLFIFCLMNISRESEERNVKSNKRRYKQVQVHKKR